MNIFFCIKNASILSTFLFAVCCRRFVTNVNIESNQILKEKHVMSVVCIKFRRNYSCSKIKHFVCGIFVNVQKKIYKKSNLISKHSYQNHKNALFAVE